MSDLSYTKPDKKLKSVQAELGIAIPSKRKEKQKRKKTYLRKNKKDKKKGLPDQELLTTNKPYFAEIKSIPQRNTLEIVRKKYNPDRIDRYKDRNKVLLDKKLPTKLKNEIINIKARKNQQRRTKKRIIIHQNQMQMLKNRRKYLKNKKYFTWEVQLSVKLMNISQKFTGIRSLKKVTFFFPFQLIVLGLNVRIIIYHASTKLMEIHDTFTGYDLYCIVKVGSKQYQTSIASNAMNPEWDNQDFMFDKRDGKEVIVQIWDKDSGIDDKIGSSTFLIIDYIKDVKKKYIF